MEEHFHGCPLPSVFSVQCSELVGPRLYGAAVFGVEERGASVLLLPVTLGEPLNSVFSFFNRPSGGKKQNLFLLHEILKDQSVKLLGNSLN